MKKQARIISIMFLSIITMLFSCILFACTDNKDIQDSSQEENIGDDIKEIKYTITFDSQGGIGGTASVQAEFGQALPLISIPTKNDYTFSGYFSDKNGIGDVYYSSQGISLKDYDVNSNITLYAYWIYNYEHIVISNGNYEQYFDIRKDVKLNGFKYGNGTADCKITYTVSLRGYTTLGPKTNVTLAFYDGFTHSYVFYKYKSKNVQITQFSAIIPADELTYPRVHLVSARGILSVPINN